MARAPPPICSGATTVCMSIYKYLWFFSASLSLRFATIPEWLFASLIFSGTVRSETEGAALECLKSATFLAPIDSSAHRKYAPDREVDALHLALEVTPDFKQRTVEGKATIRFKPIARPVEELKLDAVDLEVHSVTATEKIQTYQVTDEKVIVTFAEPIPPDK